MNWFTKLFFSNPRLVPSKEKFELLPPEKLIEAHKDLIEQLYFMFGFSHEMTKKLIMPAIHRFAEWVHLLPASELHHHSEPGGLFRHSLEVGARSLQLMDANYVFDMDQYPAYRKYMEWRWQVCFFLSGLLHDFGKIFSGMLVVVDRGKEEPDIWNPATTSLYRWAKARGIASYQLAWERGRGIGEHEKLSGFYAHKVLHEELLDWFTPDYYRQSKTTKPFCEPYTRFRAFLLGESCPILSEVVQDSDRESVQRYLKKYKPYLLDLALRQAVQRMLAEEEKALNLPRGNFQTGDLESKVESETESETETTPPKSKEPDPKANKKEAYQKPSNPTDSLDQTPPSSQNPQEQIQLQKTEKILGDTSTDKAILKIAQVLANHLDWVDVDNLLFRHPEVLDAAGLSTIENIKKLRDAGYLESPDPYNPLRMVVEKNGLRYLKYSKKAAEIFTKVLREAYPIPIPAEGVCTIKASLKPSTEIAEEFKRVREALGISQAELAERLGVSRGLVSLIEISKRQVEEELLQKLRLLVE